MGVKLVVVDRSVDDMAEEYLTDAGIMVLQRVSSREIDRLCRHTGARKIKRTGLNRDVSALLSYIGQAGRVLTDDKLEYTMVLDGRGQNAVAVMIGAATAEVVDERERMAKDAAAAVQSALRSGVVPRRRCRSVAASRVEDMARQQQGMSSYGLICVKEALIRPFTCMAANAASILWKNWAM
jgi:chaperonin GroEL (HSP60 family)